MIIQQNVIILNLVLMISIIDIQSFVSLKLQSKFKKPHCSHQRIFKLSNYCCNCKVYNLIITMAFTLAIQAMLFL